MTLVAKQLPMQRFRAPTAREKTLQVPHLSQARSLWSDNRHLLNIDAAHVVISNVLLPEMRRTAQLELLAMAREHTRQYLPEHPLAKQSPVDRRTPEEQVSPSLIVSGHQPELFHPGVWYKNFALDSIAQQTGSVGINLIIDNDLCATAGVHVPSGRIDDPQSAYVPYDTVADAVPWEDRPVINETLFQSFGSRLAEALVEGAPAPLAASIWNDVDQLPLETLNLGERLAALRHRCEFHAGLRTLEVPLSRVCETESFARFAASLLNDAARFQRLHNVALDEYRKANRLRSKTHPVPDLALDGDWVETPFWIWTAEQPQRRHLFVRFNGGQVTLSNRVDLSFEIGRDDLPEWLANASNDGLRIRSRALITTMYARLMLSALFLHGIGGAKYDELTDLLISRFFEITPPKFMVLSATVHLPVASPNVDAVDLTHLRQLLRSLQYHPERFLESQGNLAPEAERLIRVKRDLLKAMPTSGSKRDWHRQIVAVNEQMQPLLRERAYELQAELERLQRDLHIKQILASREITFVAYPRTLADQLKHWADDTAAPEPLAID